MFWSKKAKEEKKKKEAAAKSEKLREEAMANARAARERIGEETLDKIASAMMKKQQSEIERAKAQIKAADSNKVVDEILWMLEDKD